MKAVMLAAGVGVRLGNSGTRNVPKVLLRFGDKSLLQRHIDILKRHGIEELVLGVGFHREEIAQEIAALGAEGFVRTVFNQDYEAGSIVTLWTLRDELRRGGPVLLMDGDVLYDDRLMKRLVTSDHASCLLLDRIVALDDEAVKLCIRDREIVEFRKWLSTEFDFCGESIGFIKMSARVADSIIAQTRLYLAQNRHQDPYEEPIRDVILTSRRETIGYEDVTGLPWIEIDYAADVERATTEILPRIVAAARLRHTATMPGREPGRATYYE
ncbi:MAG: phosphocholine cytidylyltransferase family protein [Gammaproteobacteria bacterium]|nr:MAG: phosphocholine cytidylyltransferase family protein [Gammaproteobacteria bacterium]